MTVRKAPKDPIEEAMSRATNMLEDLLTAQGLVDNGHGEYAYILVLAPCGDPEETGTVRVCSNVHPSDSRNLLMDCLEQHPDPSETN